MAINLAKEEKAEIIKKFGKDAKDSGSAEVQIALLTQKITELTEHLKANKKDFQGRRGLLMMVGQRKRLLAYVKKQDLQKYRDLIKTLGIIYCSKSQNHFIKRLDNFIESFLHKLTLSKLLYIV